MANNNVELLELIAELNMSDDKSRQAIGAEVKRLTAALRAENERLMNEVGRQQWGVTQLLGAIDHVLKNKEVEHIFEFLKVNAASVREALKE